MQQLISIWNALDARRRTIVAITTTVSFALILLLARVAGTPSMALLYSGLEPSVSGEVIGALEQHDVEFSVQGNAIYIDSTKRDFMRMALAEEGLPASGTAGYELLDNLTGFGTTAQMFDTAYWRAKEGELARTILAWPQVKSARVHIANQQQKPFAQSAAPVASVTLKLSSGGLSNEHAQALKFLVASAVAGMSPQNVSIIDSDRGLVAPVDPAGINIGQNNRRSAQLKASVERLLSARVGAGNAIVEIAILTDLEKETIVERRFDPDSRVAISTDTEEVTGGSTGSGNTGVTVASNLPDGDAQAGDQTSKSTNSETRERINYEVSETTRELIKSPGNINRLSVAVLVNNKVEFGADGTQVITPRTDEELASLRALVESAVGFDADRGDSVTLRSLDFQPLPDAGTLATASIFAGLFANSTSLMQSGLLAMVILGLGMFVVRPILLAGPQPEQTLPQLASTLAPADFDQPLEISAPEKAPNPEPVLDPVAQLRQIISERQEESIEVLQNWIDADEENA